MKLLEGLNNEQKRAVVSDSPHILLLAGAGSGKTKTLTTRIAYLNQNRVGTVNMLALTFTRLAGQEMKERVIKLIGEEEGKKLFCNTFHAFCVKLLKEFGKLVGVHENFTIYDQEDQESIIQAIINEHGYNKKIKVKDVLHDIEMGRKREVDSFWSRESHQAAIEYDYRLRQNNATDLDGLLYAARDVLEDDRARAELHHRYKYVFVDEFQDTNNIQMETIKLLNPENLFVVGDDFQAIYGWRGANVNLILDFPQMYPGCEVIKLERNYRSTKEIVEAANNLISHNTKQTKKKLISEAVGVAVTFIAVQDEEQEANSIAGNIKLETKGNWSNFAILARTNRQLETIKNYLGRNNIPTQLIYNRDDVMKKHDIKMLLAAMEIAINPGDSYSLRKLLKFPQPRITQVTLEECELKALDNEIPLMDVLEQEKVKHLGISQLVHCGILLRQSIREGDDALQMFYLTYELIGAKQYHENKNLTNRIKDFESACDYIAWWMQRQTELGESTNSQAFLRWLRLKDIQEKLAEEKNAVKLMTVHASKGLEFPVVFVIGMNQGTFPSKRTQDLEEERRLFYVAITRAKERLHITRPIETIPWGNQVVAQEESQFLEELLKSVS
ncbi:MAG: ATP-dependent helicase [Clostridia bacterium]|nr:ATP-dependent helicase [Clostridia bacterium]